MSFSLVLTSWTSDNSNSAYFKSSLAMEVIVSFCKAQEKSS